MQRARRQDLHGIDVSHWQGVIDWKSVKRDSVKFAYLKASEGTSWVDPMFFINAGEGRDAGLAMGAYHFARPDLNLALADAKAEAEARHFIDTLKRGFGDYGDIYPVLDLETPHPKKDFSVQHLLTWVDTFRSYFEGETEDTLMLYTGIYFIREYNDFKLSRSRYPLSKMPLWVAMYPKSASPYNTAPPDAGNWTSWIAWQYTDKGKIEGITGNVDLNLAIPRLLA